VLLSPTIAAKSGVTSLEAATALCPPTGVACSTTPNFTPISATVTIAIPTGATSVTLTGMGWLQNNDTFSDTLAAVACYSTDVGKSWAAFPSALQGLEYLTLTSSQFASMPAIGFFTTKTAPALTPGASYLFAVCGYTGDSSSTNTLNLYGEGASGNVVVE